jgi:hypothetical protein
LLRPVHFGHGLGRGGFVGLHHLVECGELANEVGTRDIVTALQIAGRIR